VRAGHKPRDYCKELVPVRLGLSVLADVVGALPSLPSLEGGAAGVPALPPPEAA
jgi:hypothetical protein